MIVMCAYKTKISNIRGNMVYGAVWQSVFLCAVLLYSIAGVCVAAVHNEAKHGYRGEGAIRGACGREL